MFEVKTFEEIGKTKWDEFVASTDNGSIHQMSSWKNLQEKVPTRGRVLGWGVVKNNQLQATALLTRMKTGVLNAEWYYCGRGPVFTDKVATKFLIEQITKNLKNEKSAIFWRYDPYILASEEALLPNTSFSNATAHYHPLDTSIIQLDKPADQMLAGLKKSRRYDIRQGLKNFEIKRISSDEITDTDIDDFYQMLSTTAQSNGFMPHPKSYYKDFLKELGQYATLWFAIRQGKRVAGSIMTTCQDKAIYYFAAMSSDQSIRKLNPAHALLWKQIEYAQKQGAASFDLLGIAPANSKDHPYVGITMFKTGFGGKSISYQPGIEVSLRPLLHQIYRLAKRLR